MWNYLFTIIWEFREGTFIDQIESDSINNAFAKWITKEIKKNPILSTKDLKFIEKDVDFEVDNPVPVKNRKNVWSSWFSVKDEFILVNVIKH